MPILNSELILPIIVFGFYFDLVYSIMIFINDLSILTQLIILIPYLNAINITCLFIHIITLLIHFIEFKALQL